MGLGVAIVILLWFIVSYPRQFAAVLLLICAWWALYQLVR